MTDIRLDEDFQIFFGEDGDMGTVEDIREFEQQLRLAITDYFFNHIGGRNTTNVVKKLRMEARRAADDNEFVTSVQSIEVDEQEGDTLRLSINYNYDQSYEFEVE